MEGVGTGDQEAIAFPFLPHSQDGIRPEHWLDGLGTMGSTGWSQDSLVNVLESGILRFTKVG